ncbi:hypothetical protein F442_02986 [Phytophthora nicotianae P10297]|uniref:Uncharacterized protein n=1 Tax=Phytophthora nicotianae P10297 TaxID=1317064 RepID=W2ZX60_PHYNI|nr:hypothetical protein F442_02986 [Phytophthora nicotianae P10297]
MCTSASGQGSNPHGSAARSTQGLRPYGRNSHSRQRRRERGSRRLCGSCTENAQEAACCCSNLRRCLFHPADLECCGAAFQ